MVYILLTDLPGVVSRWGMQPLMKHALCIASWGALGLVALAPAPALAGTVLTVTAKGTIPSSCSIASAGDFTNVSDFTQSGQRTTSATVNCNQGFTITAKSAKGAITTAASLPAGSAYTNTLPYTLKLDVPLDSGSVSIPSCASATMVGAGCSVSSGGTSAMGKTAALTVSWTSPSMPRLIAGSYSDTITLSIAPTP